MNKKKNVKDAYDAYCDGSYDEFYDLRETFFEAVESNGFDGTLEALGFPTRTARPSGLTLIRGSKHRLRVY